MASKDENERDGLDGLNEAIDDPKLILRAKLGSLGVAGRAVQHAAPSTTPKSEEDPEDLEEAKQMARAPSGHMHFGAGGKAAQRTLLLVEDVRVSQRVTKAALTREKWKVDCVGTGAEAISAWEKGKFYMILMDINLGEHQIDGVETSRRIRQMEAELHKEPVLIFGLTGAVSEGDIERYKTAQMNGVIAKGNVITQAVQEALRQHEADPGKFIVALLDVRKH